MHKVKPKGCVFLQRPSQVTQNARNNATEFIEGGASEGN